MTIILRLTLFFLIGFSLTSHAEKLAGACGIVSGAGYAFSMTAPKGWIIDSESGKKFNIALVFYPVDTEWGKSGVMLYVRSRIKSGMIQTVEQQIDSTIQDYRSHGHPNFNLQEKSIQKLANGTEVTVAQFTGDSWGNNEIIGYFNEEKTINFLVLNAKTEAIFHAAQPIFQQILGSYRSVTDFGSEYINSCGVLSQSK